MTDIVERLRAVAWVSGSSTLADAITEIETLRAEVTHWKRELAETLDNEGLDVPEELKEYVDD